MRVLVATDGSEDARAAVAWLTQFPLPAEAELRVVSVVHLPPPALDVPTVHDFLNSMREDARSAAEGARATLAATARRVDAQVAEGDARDVIVRMAEQWRADLVVVGARGLGAVAGALLGSVSLGVARHAPCAVLVVKGAALRLRGVLVGIDGSEHSTRAAEFLARLPLDRELVVRLLGVAERPRAPATTPRMVTGMIGQAIEQIVAERRAALEPALSKAAALFAGRVKKVERQVVAGHPADAIVAAAGRDGVGLIVVGARGLGALERLLLGSVSEGVLRHADRPVLIVKGERA